jgi:hypothetical protein
MHPKEAWLGCALLALSVTACGSATTVISVTTPIATPAQPGSASPQAVVALAQQFSALMTQANTELDRQRTKLSSTDFAAR